MTVNVGGTPRKYDRDKIAADLIEWAKNGDSLNLNKFCALNNLDPKLLLDWKDIDKRFAESYRTAKTHLAYRREEQLNNGSLHQAAYNKNARVYDAFIDKEEREFKAYEASMKQPEQTTPQKVVFEVNYKNNDNANDQVEISPQTISTTSS